MKLDTAVPAGLDGFMAGVVSDLAFGTQQLKRHLNGLTPEQLIVVPIGLSNSIATIAVHVAGAEVHFAHGLAGKKVPDELRAAFFMDRAENGDLQTILGESVESLVDKLDRARAMLLETLISIQHTDLDEELPFGKDTATRRFYLSLLPYHLASHTGQIQMVKKLITR